LSSSSSSFSFSCSFSLSFFRSSGLNKRWIQLNRRSRSSSGSHTEKERVPASRVTN
jgi:hypothetical protein